MVTKKSVYARNDGWSFDVKCYTSELDFLNTALHDAGDADSLVLCALFKLGTEES